jgi:HD domain
VLVTTDELNAYREIERIQRELSTFPVSPEGPIAMSVGVATFPTRAADAPELQRTADGGRRTLLVEGARQEPNLHLQPDGRAHHVAAGAGARDRAECAAPRREEPSCASSTLATRRRRCTPRSSRASRRRSGSSSASIRERSTISGWPASLHDIGKIGLPDSILRAPRPLTDDEYAMVQRHPEFGHELLDGIGIEPVNDWVLHHHEHWNGSGYPHGLTGEAIPLGSRIVLVADAFEAMTADRPYRQAPGHDYALHELRANAGTQFDPVVVAALERHLAGSRKERVEALA